MMKRIAMFLVAVAMVAAAYGQSTGLRFGVKAGVGLNKLSFDEEVLETSNRTNFNVGVMAEWETPIIGLGLDGAVLYARRNGEIKGIDSKYYNRDYVDIPVNIKYKIYINGLQNRFVPYAFTGPEFAFLVSKDHTSGGSSFETLSTSWNIGAGAEISRHFQIAVGYNMGMKKSIRQTVANIVDGESVEQQFKGTERSWNISVAYLF